MWIGLSNHTIQLCKNIIPLVPVCYSECSCYGLLLPPQILWYERKDTDTLFAKHDHLSKQGMSSIYNKKCGGRLIKTKTNKIRLSKDTIFQIIIGKGCLGARRMCGRRCYQMIWRYRVVIGQAGRWEMMSFIWVVFHLKRLWNMQWTCPDSN